MGIHIPTAVRTTTATLQKRKHKNIDGGSLSSSTTTTATTATSYIVVSMLDNFRDPDMMEIMVGGQRYELVPLPDSMLDTTIFVGNLCEFAQDEDLSRAFQTVSILQSVPACVARRSNSQSLEYGFVTFPTVEEKKVAILQFHGTTFMGRKLRVEEIIDDRRKGRIRVPERMVSYVLGEAKIKPRSKNNDLSLRRISSIPQKREADENNRNKDSHQNRPKRNRKRETRRHLRRRSRRSDYDEDFFVS